LHTAREDAFPLVCVEAAALGRPIVSFENGGAAELIRRSGCGRVVPFPDVDAAVGALTHLADEPAERAALGAHAAEFAADHLVLDRRGPGLLGIRERTMSDDPPD
ncbi:MAG: glycosyltransferase, partial [Acidimicrobiales bacterium]|nr:glycosyltransferase [Acidimicrobiales bacterium]